MKNLREYLTEAKVNSKEPIYMYFAEELADAETFDEILTEIQPVCVLKANDYDEESGQIKVKGELVSCHYSNLDGEDDQEPKKGDMVFEYDDVYALYRPGIGVPSGFGDVDATFGTKQELVDNLLEYKKEMKTNWHCDVEKLLGMK